MLPSRLSSWFSWLYTRTLGERIVAIDALRGLAIAGMVLVNHPPPGVTPYAPFVHSTWVGWTLADTIFPTFLFVVGVSLSITLLAPDAGRAIPYGRLYGKILRRGLLLVLISVLLVNFPYYDLETLKVTGTLTRIGLCSVLVSLVIIHVNWRTQVLLMTIVLVANWLILQHLGAAAFLELDRAILGPHFRPDRADGYDSDGIAATLGAFATTLSGAIAGNWLQAQANMARQAAGMLVCGLLASVAGAMLGIVQSVSMLVWSSAYVVQMAGISMLALGATLAVVRHPMIRPLLRPLQIAGLNALAFYLGARLLQLLAVYGRVQDSTGEPIKLGTAVYGKLFSGWVGAESGALLYALTFLVVCYCLTYALFRLRVFIKL